VVSAILFLKASSRTSLPTPSAISPTKKTILIYFNEFQLKTIYGGNIDNIIMFVCQAANFRLKLVIP
jgi:hypothetical protein